MAAGWNARYGSVSRMRPVSLEHSEAGPSLSRCLRRGGMGLPSTWDFTPRGGYARQPRWRRRDRLTWTG